MGAASRFPTYPMMPHMAQRSRVREGGGEGGPSTSSGPVRPNRRSSASFTTRRDAKSTGPIMAPQCAHTTPVATPTVGGLSSGRRASACNSLQWRHRIVPSCPIKIGAAVPRPLVLIASAQEWVTRSLESIPRPAGYAVLKAYTGRDALEGARRSAPDVVILDNELPETDVLALCRALRVDPYITPSTPILVTSPGPLARAQVIDALRAGANGVWGQPLDTEEFLLRLEGHVRAKLDADAAREGGLLDPRTGLYNARGLERRARELAAQVDRREASLACIALASEANGSALAD